jgi:sulfite reductase beta subunit
LGRVVAPFVPITDSLQIDEVLSIIGRVIEVWRKRAGKEERLGDFAERIGWPAFFHYCGLPFDRRNVDLVEVATVRRNLQIKDEPR